MKHMTEEMQPIKPKAEQQSPERLFIVIGILWLILGGFILYQLPDSRSNFITIEWETETETDTAGFNVYRAKADENPPSADEKCLNVDADEYEQVNLQLINSEGGAQSGARYEYKDFSVERGTDYCYQLEDIELSGTRTRHDPIDGPRLRQIDRILYMILAPVSLMVGVWLIVSGLRKGNN